MDVLQFSQDPDSAIRGSISCSRCEGTFWVCEAHDDRLWDSGATTRPSRSLAAIERGQPAADYCRQPHTRLPFCAWGGAITMRKRHAIVVAGGLTLLALSAANALAQSLDVGSANFVVNGCRRFAAHDDLKDSFVQG